MSEYSERLKVRTRSLALEALRLVDELPPLPSAEAIGRQLAKSAPSVSANYRAACGARSAAEFVAKLGVVVEEAEESEHWLGLVEDRHLVATQRVHPLRTEAHELVKIFAKSLGTARRNRRVQSHKHSK